MHMVKKSKTQFYYLEITALNMCIFVCVGGSIYSTMGIYYYSN